MQQLSIGLAARATEMGVVLKLRKAVRRVRQLEGPRKVDDEDELEGSTAPPLEIELEGGESITSSLVVLAMPPPVWGSTIAFDPPLPEAKREIGRRTFMGCAVKCVFIFGDAFWRKSPPMPREPGGRNEGSSGCSGGEPCHEEYRGEKQQISSPIGTNGQLSARNQILSQNAVDGKANKAGKGAGAGTRLEDLGPIANLFPSVISGKPALVGIATARRAREFSRLPSEAARRGVALAQLAAHFRRSERDLEVRGSLATVGPHPLDGLLSCLIYCYRMCFK